MWLLVWAVVLVLVHVQFLHCRVIVVGVLKVVETSLIVLAVRLWTELDSTYDLLLPLETLWNATLASFEL
jgi:hypothetical protein